VHVLSAWRVSFTCWLYTRKAFGWTKSNIIGLLDGNELHYNYLFSPVRNQTTNFKRIILFGKKQKVCNHSFHSWKYCSPIPFSFTFPFYEPNTIYIHTCLPNDQPTTWSQAAILKLFIVAPPCLIIVSINSPREFTQGLWNKMKWISSLVYV
jgi:hypothetical protein